MKNYRGYPKQTAASLRWIAHLTLAGEGILLGRLYLFSCRIERRMENHTLIEYTKSVILKQDEIVLSCFFSYFEDKISW